MVCSLYCSSSLLHHCQSPPTLSSFPFNSSPSPLVACGIFVCSHLATSQSCTHNHFRSLCALNPLLCGPTTLLTSTSSHLKLLTTTSTPSLTLFGWRDFNLIKKARHVVVPLACWAVARRMLQFVLVGSWLFPYVQGRKLDWRFWVSRLDLSFCVGLCWLHEGEERERGEECDMILVLWFFLFVRMLCCWWTFFEFRKLWLPTRY